MPHLSLLLFRLGGLAAGCFAATAEFGALATVPLEDVADYKAFEAAIITDYDVQSAVERELVLRLASLLWRLRRATTMETGLFDIQADCLREFRQGRQAQPCKIRQVEFC